jgi:hypothetical protein
VVEEGQEELALAGEVPVDRALREPAALGDGLLMQKIVFPDLDLPRALRDAVELMLRGIEKP